jgi:hypothetical protein
MCTQVWRSILSEQPSFKGSSWKEISQQAKDFCSSLLNKCVRACVMHTGWAWQCVPQRAVRELPWRKLG